MDTQSDTIYTRRRHLEFLPIKTKKEVKEINSALKAWLLDRAGDRRADANRQLRGKPEEYHAYVNRDAGVILESTGHIQSDLYLSWIYSAKIYNNDILSTHIIAAVQEFPPHPFNSQSHSANLTVASEFYCPAETEKYTDLPQHDINKIIDKYREPKRIMHPDDTPLDLELLMKNQAVIALPWQDNNEPNPKALWLIEEWSDFIDCAVIDHAGHRTIAKALRNPELLIPWHDAQAAIISQYDPYNTGLNLTPLPIDSPDEVAKAIRRYDTTSRTHTASQSVWQMLNGMLASANPPTIPRTFTNPKHDSDTTCHHEQRVFILEDQLKLAREKLRQYERDLGPSIPNEPEPESEPTPEPQEPDYSQVTLLEAIVLLTPERYPNLTFLDSVLNNADYPADPTQTADVIAALDAIESLAIALHNTPNRKVGNWANFFRNLTGWTYSPQDSPTTMGKYGKQRKFTHRDNIHTISRHLTNTARTSGVQIYFDTDDRYGRQIMVAYIGPHLPYATQ